MANKNAGAIRAKYSSLKKLLPDFPGEIAAGAEAVCAVAAAADTDLVLAAISGMAGIIPVVRAIEAGKDIAFANKEVLVAAGDVVNVDVSAELGGYFADTGGTRVLPTAAARDLRLCHAARSALAN
ncbi:MAG: hypothetical protein GX409_06380, partial [candidate division Zixibacteria bacterium]|nr:hypothetical protein [candidate division Zixibacteria bacterium]